MPQPTITPFNALDAETFTGLSAAEDEAVFLSMIESHLEQAGDSLQTLEATLEELTLSRAGATVRFQE